VGHANLSNVSDFFVKRLYAKGRLSVKDCSDAMQKAGETIHASEGEHDEPYMLRMGLEDVIRFMLEFDRDDGPDPIIEPIDPTREQRALLRKWRHGDFSDWDSGDDGEGGEYGAFDAIEWKFAPGWRKRYPKIPKLRNVTH
jgi:hypothetical protein